MSPVLLGDAALSRRSNPRNGRAEFWCLMRVVIEDQESGRVATFTSDELLDDTDGDYTPYMWEEGNFSCDCNRHLFWARALGLPEPEVPPCTDERFIVRQIMRLDTGEVVYGEDDARVPIYGEDDARVPIV